jgi:hypothetical protein
MLTNIRKQKNFYLKKVSFETFKIKGLDFLKEKNYDDAHYAFTKCLAIFKYIKSIKPNWKNEGIKDEDLEYFDDYFTENNDINKEEIKKMKIISLLNISLCELSVEKFKECREACDEVLKLDENNIKA